MFKDFPLPLLIVMLIACVGVILIACGLFLAGFALLGVATIVAVSMVKIYFVE